MAGESDDELIVVNLSDDGDDDGAPALGGEDRPKGGAAQIAKVRASDDDDAVSDLRGQLASMRSNLETANQRAVTIEADNRRLAAENQRAKLETADSQIETLNSGIAAAKARADAAEQALVAAQEIGDFKASSKAQREIAAAEAERVQLTGALEDLQAQRKVAPAATEAPQTRPAAASADPVEAFVANRTAPTAAWIRQHPEFVTDPRKSAKLTAAHWDAVGSDLAPDSKEYFAHVEKFLGIAKNNDGGDVKPATQRRPGAPVAPVRAGDSGQSGSSATEVKLTKREAESATDGTLVWNYDDPSGKKRFKKGDPIGLQEMARRKQYGIKQGLYDKSYSEG